MDSNAYNDDQAVTEYLSKNFHDLMTDVEKRSLYLATKREKAEHGSAHRLPSWLAAETDDIIQASLAGYEVLFQQIRERILRDYRAGRLIINRCPECSRIVRTPFAKQCLWCGHDWHGK